jgi:hypothetical protein
MGIKDSVMVVHSEGHFQPFCFLFLYFKKRHALTDESNQT